MAIELKTEENKVKALQEEPLETRIKLLKHILDEQKIFFTPSNPFLLELSPLVFQKIIPSSKLAIVIKTVELYLPEAAVSSSSSQIMIAASNKITSEILYQLRSKVAFQYYGEPGMPIIETFFALAAPVLKLIDISNERDNATFISCSFSETEAVQLMEEVRLSLPKEFFNISFYFSHLLPGKQRIIIEFIKSAKVSPMHLRKYVRDHTPHAHVANGSFIERSKSFANALKSENINLESISVSKPPSSAFHEIINNKLSK